MLGSGKWAPCRGSQACMRCIVRQASSLLSSCNECTVWACTANPHWTNARMKRARGVRLAGGIAAAGRCGTTRGRRHRGLFSPWIAVQRCLRCKGACQTALRLRMVQGVVVAGYLLYLLCRFHRCVQGCCASGAETMCGLGWDSKTPAAGVSAAGGKVSSFLSQLPCFCHNAAQCLVQIFERTPVRLDHAAAGAVHT